MLILYLKRIQYANDLRLQAEIFVRFSTYNIFDICGVGSAREVKIMRKKKVPIEIATGCAVGAANGLLGGGGGMLCVPLLEKALKEDVKVSHATTVLVILPVCIASAIVYWTSGKFEFTANLPVIFGVVAGGAIGSVLLKVMRGKFVAVIFAVLMIIAGIRMAF